MESGNGPDTKELDQNEEQEVLALLATLVRAHYLEKSSRFHTAMDFEKLFRLDRLDQLKYLEELQQLKNLDQLRSMENLKDLSKLSELSSLSKLSDLVHLDKLEQLKQLEKLDRLNALSDLDHLEKLDQLENLKSLRQLDKLSAIATLSKLLDEHQNTLKPLTHLDKLEDLVYLNELEKLNELKRLDNLKELDKLNKLDRIDDARFAERLNKLDKLDILKKETKKLVIQQVIGLGLESFKVVTVALLIVFFLSRETGREIAIKALPALGFGSAGQVNLGLKLLVGETSPQDFSQHLGDVKNRIKVDLAQAISPSGFLSLHRRLEIVEELQTYSFKGAGVDLHKETQKNLQASLKKLSEDAISRLDFNMSLAQGKQDQAKEDILREIKLLLMQQQYPQLLEKSLSSWGKDDAIDMAVIAGSVSLSLKDPNTLKEIIKKELPGEGKL